MSSGNSTGLNAPRLENDTSSMKDGDMNYAGLETQARQTAHAIMLIFYRAVH